MKVNWSDKQIACTHITIDFIQAFDCHLAISTYTGILIVGEEIINYNYGPLLFDLH